MNVNHEVRAARYRHAIDEAIRHLECGLVHEAHNVLRQACGLTHLRPLMRTTLPPQDADGNRPQPGAA